MFLGGTKEMKKSLLVLSALLALSMAFVGCKNGGSDPVESDPDWFTGKGALTLNAYDTVIDLDAPISLDGYTTFEATVRICDKNGVSKFAVQTMASNGAQSSATVAIEDLSKTESFVVTGACGSTATYQSWPGPVDKDCANEIGKIQVYAQDSSYAAMVGPKILLEKVVVKGEGKEDLVVFENN